MADSIELLPAIKAVPMDEPAPKVLLMGQPGSGKTLSLATLLELGLEVFVIFTEQGRESLLEGVEYYGLEAQRSKLHWTTIKAGSPGFGNLAKTAKELNTKDQSALQGAKGVGQKHYDQMVKLINACGDFTDQHGENFGDASEWGNDRVLVIDGLSGINVMAMDLVVGAKPVKTQADWGIAMDAQMRFIQQCVNGLTCGFVLVSHLEINKDEVEGKMYRYPRLLGNKNTYDFGKYFSDVILAEDKGDKYVWSTQEKTMQLKSRNLKKSANHEPSFVPLYKKWAERYGE